MLGALLDDRNVLHVLSDAGGMHEAISETEKVLRDKRMSKLNSTYVYKKGSVCWNVLLLLPSIVAVKTSGKRFRNPRTV